ncbi:YbjN domain-containing protein [Paracoccus saliphilus]|uniref:Sensory transduction regulator n=1 Tax=Paracoccus saliphilus TaxID=405559 RepID=A0AA46A5Y6_9RHOB|nr:YbjN domain-containing protein [Paracoccus saliphilus]WCR04700.1 YbjN domain-containing protein [Paracoccus saliphilus]SIS88579.1 Putative sensory transduction regulator [Paracoccus saliphilus]
MRRLTASLCLALMPMNVAAQVTGDPEVIEILMQDAGFPVYRDTDSYGDPRIRSVVDDTLFSVYFYDCGDGPCRALQLKSVFDGAQPRGLALVNAWNREYRFGSAFLDAEGDPVIELDINLAEDGVGRRNFNEVLDGWTVLLSDFRNHINW